MAPPGEARAAEQAWEVVGGADRGGIIVREGQELTAPQAPTRLATGAIVTELRLVGERLQYRLLEGAGPATGWVSTRLKDRQLLQRCATDGGRDAPSPASPSAGRARAAPAPGSDCGQQLSGDELRKACKEFGFFPGSLEDRKLAPVLLERVRTVGRLSVPELRNEIRKRGYATTSGMLKEDLVQRLRDILVWEHFRAGELRRICLEVGIPTEDVEPTRENFLTLLADATWQSRGVPAWRLPSPIVAFGVLDQVDAMESKDVEELALLCEKRGLPVEDEPEQAVLAERLRTVVVWEHLSVDELRRECEVFGIELDDLAQADQPSGGIMFRGVVAHERERHKELVRRLTELLWQAAPPAPDSELLPEDDPLFPQQIAGFLERLQLHVDAGPKDLRRAYKESARRLHPDKNPGREDHVTAEFQEISKAYEALGEHMRRRGAYDA